MNCPNCNTENKSEVHNCQKCGFGLSCRPDPPKRSPSYLGDRAEESGAEEMARKFVCPTCKSCGGKPRRIATTGAGLSRILNIQNNNFAAIACDFCKSVQLYELSSSDSKSAWALLDYFWSLACAAILLGVILFLFSLLVIYVLSFI